MTRIGLKHKIPDSSAERIRDKIAASKKKGLWMGGTVPLGYEPNGRTLSINEQEAETVRTLYGLYDQHQNLTAVTGEADRLDLRGKAGNTQKSFSRGHVHQILINPLYAGRIRHKDQVYDGQHPAIIEPEAWERVQSQLTAGASRQRGKPNRVTKGSPLIGKLFDETGDRLTPSHANKQGRRYRYYVSNRLISKPCSNHGKPTTSSPATPGSSGWRLPAQNLEDQLVHIVADHISRGAKTDLLSNPGTQELERMQSVLAPIKTDAQSNHRMKILDCIERATLKAGSIEITLASDPTARLIGIDKHRIAASALTFTAPFQTRRRGAETKLIIGETTTENKDDVLIANIARAHAYYDAVKAGKTFEQVAEQNGTSKRRVNQLISLAFIAPDICKSIMLGTQPIDLTSEWLLRHPLPSDWQEQRRIIAAL